MSEPSKKIVLPAYLIRRCEAFRIVKGDAYSYVVRDKLHGKTYDYEPWQFFILEVLPGCESMEKLQSVFEDRFDRTITKAEVDELFAVTADRKLFDESAAQHPLLAPFTRRTYEVVDGKAQPRSNVAQLELVGAASKGEPPAKAEPAAENGGDDLPPGVQDADGLDPRTTRHMIELFDPRPLLRVITPVLAPLRHVAYALPLLVLVSLGVVIRYGDLLLADLNAMHPQVSLFTHLVFALLTVNLTATITMACVGYAFRAAVERIGITLYVGFIPRFIARIRAEQLGRRERMWLHGSSLIVRAFLLCVGVLLWYNTRSLPGVVHQTSLMLVLTCFGSLVLETGNPFVRANTYFLLSAYLNEPHLRGKAHMALLNKLRGGVYRSADSTVLALYGAACITYVVVLALFITAGLAHWLMRDLHLGGAAIAIGVGLAGFLLWRDYIGLRKFGEAYKRATQFDRWRTRTLVDEEKKEEGEVASRKRPNYWARALIIGGVLLLFIPYRYEASGSFSIFPARKQVMSTDVPGLVEEVYFDGGEALKQGTVIARLAHDDYTAQIKVLDARIEEQKAVVADLKSRPKPEEVKVAEQALAVAKTREKFSREKVPRIAKLYDSGLVTFEELDSVRKDHDTDIKQVAEKQAALELVKAGVTADQIAAAEAKLVSLKQERDVYVAKVDRMTLRMPFDGNILTLHLKDRTNTYLDKGQIFATIENTGVVTAEIRIVESDLQYIDLGSTIRARPVAFFNREFDGTLTTIDREVTSQSLGTFAKVIATIDNHNGLLKTGMTGEAKISGITMPVWEAFSQAVIRFVKVQVWSWIP